MHALLNKPLRDNGVLMRRCLCRLVLRRGGSFGLKMFISDQRNPHSDFPKLSGSVKAAECRSLVPVIAELCERYDIPGDVEWRTRTLCIRNLVRFYDACDEAGVFPSASERARMAKSTTSCLALYSSLAREAADSGKKKWSIVNKHHFFYHLGVDDSFVNARQLWCYQGEDFQRHISTAANSCAVGTPVFIGQARRES